MEFKQWLNEGRFKGLLRRFKQIYPDMPDYVAKDLYNNRISYQMRKMLQSPESSPTIGVDADGTGAASPYAQVPSDIMTKNKFGDVIWGKKPIVVTIHPDNFDDYTLQIFLYRRFGLKPVGKVRNDIERTQTQTKLLNQGENEPIIMIKNGDKYEMIEGWHRVMANLLYLPNPDFGAPPDQIDMLKKNDVTRIDFTRWKPVRIRAYIGTKKS